MDESASFRSRCEVIGRESGVGILSSRFVRSAGRFDASPRSTVSVDSPYLGLVGWIPQVEDRPFAQVFGLQDPRVDDVSAIDDGEVVPVHSHRARPTRIVLAPEPQIAVPGCSDRMYRAQS